MPGKKLFQIHKLAPCRQQTQQGTISQDDTVIYRVAYQIVNMVFLSLLRTNFS